MSRSYPASLPIAYVVLRLLIVANIALAVAIAALLLVLPHEAWILQSLDLDPGPEADRIIAGMRAIAVIGIVGCALNHLILKRLVRIVETVRQGDPFLPVNARRIHQIAWALLSLQLLGIGVAVIVRLINSKEHPIDIDSSASIAGWIAVLFAFILARVFAEGSAMRDDLRGTI